MVLTTIYIIRHASRPTFHTNPKTGKTSSSVPSPTGNPSDPPLTAHGVRQSQELAEVVFKPDVKLVVSSPYYRCLQTIWPLVGRLRQGRRVEVAVNAGIGEWYGTAPFKHLGAASLNILQQFFPSVTDRTTIIPNPTGESIAELHDRCALALSRIISETDKEGMKDEEEAIVIVSHAAPIIAMGRALTGNMPEDPNEVDFHTYVCSVSKFVRRKGGIVEEEVEDGDGGVKVDWRGGKGVGGGWDCVVNASVKHLSNGGERDWTFSGEEAFVLEMTDDSSTNKTIPDPIDKPNTWKL